MHSKTSATRIRAAERRSQAMKLRLAGESYREIANHLGCSPQRVHKILTKELSKIRECLQDETDQVRILELERLDSLFLQSYQKAKNGDTRAIDTCLRVMDRRAKLLGLDAAMRLTVDQTITQSDEWIRLKARIIKALQDHPAALDDMRKAMEEP